MSDEYLTLKWGSLKSWHFESDKARELLQKWASLGHSFSAALHHDTLEQKQLICDLIDAGDFETVYLDWDGKEVSKEEAKEYVMNYDKQP
jgi:hypothetical protein